MTPRQADQAQAERLRAESLRRADKPRGSVIDRIAGWVSEYLRLHGRKPTVVVVTDAVMDALADETFELGNYRHGGGLTRHEYRAKIRADAKAGELWVYNCQIQMEPDRANAEPESPHMLRGTSGNVSPRGVLTYHGVPVVFDDPLTLAEQIAGDAAWAALNGREHG